MQPQTLEDTAGTLGIFTLNERHREKPVFGVVNQARHKLVCTLTEDS